MLDVLAVSIRYLPILSHWLHAPYNTVDLHFPAMCGSGSAIATHPRSVFASTLAQQRDHVVPCVTLGVSTSKYANRTSSRRLRYFPPASCSPTQAPHGAAGQQLQRHTSKTTVNRTRHPVGDARINISSKCLPPTVNWHLEARCNYGCKFCFATFEDVKQHLHSKMDRGPISSSNVLLVPQLLKDAGASKINFVGGEPFLHPLIFPLIEAAKRAGLVTSVVTNGSCLNATKLLHLQGLLDWLAFSVDASSDELHAAMGRGLPPELQHPEQAGTAAAAAAAGPTRGGHLARVLPLWQMAQELGFRLKLNTVVTSINLHDNMAPLVVQLAPERWKVFQVLPVEGQNDGRVDPLLIQQQEFEAWVERHQPLVEAAGIPLVPETNEDMRGSYAMLDADCRFYTNASGRHEYGPSLFDVAGGVREAWSSVAGPAFSAATFLQRGGLYAGARGRSIWKQLWCSWRALTEAVARAGTDKI